MPVSPDELESPQHEGPVMMPLCDETRVRFSEAARALDAAEKQAYVEANVLVQLLDLLKEVLSMAPFVR